MQLLLRRNQETGGMFGDKVTFVLSVRAQLTDDERSAMKKYRLSEAVLFERLPEQPQDSTFTGGLSRYLHNVTITAGELEAGRQIKCASVLEVLAHEAAIKEAAGNLKAVIDECSKFGGEEVVDF